MSILDALYAGFRLSKDGVPASAVGVSHLNVIDVPQGTGTTATYDSATQVHTLALTPRVPQAHASVLCVALGNVSTTAPFEYVAEIWDDCMLVHGRNVLLAYQTNPYQNGIWTLSHLSGSNWQLSRASQSLGGYTVPGSMVFIEQGEVFGWKTFTQVRRGTAYDGQGPAYTGAILPGSEPQIWRAIGGPDYAPPRATLVASGTLPANVTLLTIPPPSEGNLLDVAVLATATNVSTQAVSSKNSTVRYKMQGGTLSVHAENTVFDTPLVILAHSTDLKIMGQRQAAGGGDYVYRVESWVQYRRVI